MILMMEYLPKNSHYCVSLSCGLTPSQFLSVNGILHTRWRADMINFKHLPPNWRKFALLYDVHFQMLDSSETLLKPIPVILFIS